MGETNRKSRLRNASSGKATTAEISRERQRTQRKRIAIGAAVGALVAVAAGFACFGPASNANTLGQADKEEPTLAPIVDTTEKVTTSTVTPLEQGAGTEGAAPAAETQGEAVAPTAAGGQDPVVTTSQQTVPAVGNDASIEANGELAELKDEHGNSKVCLFPQFPDGRFPDSDYQPGEGSTGILDLNLEAKEAGTDALQIFDVPASFILQLNQNDYLRYILMGNCTELANWKILIKRYSDNFNNTEAPWIALNYCVEFYKDDNRPHYLYNVQFRAARPLSGIQARSQNTPFALFSLNNANPIISIPYEYNELTRTIQPVYPLGVTSIDLLDASFTVDSLESTNHAYNDLDVKQQTIHIALGNTTKNISCIFYGYVIDLGYHPLAPSNLDLATATAPDWNGLTCSISGQRYSAFSPSNHNYTIEFGLNESLPGAPVLGGLPIGYSASVRSFEDAAVNGMRHVVTISNGRDSQEYSFAYSKVEGSSSGLSPATSDQVSHTGSVPGQVAPTPARTTQPAAANQGSPAANNGVGVESSKPAASQPGGAGSAPTSSAGNAASSRVAQSRASAVGAAPDGSLTQTGDAVTVVAGTTLAAAVVAAAAIARKRSQRVA